MSNSHGVGPRRPLSRRSPVGPASGRKRAPFQPSQQAKTTGVKLPTLADRSRGPLESKRPQAPAPYSAAAGEAFAPNSGSNSSLRFGKKSAQPSVTTEKTASTEVTAATLPVRSYNVDTSGAAAAAPRKPTKKRTE